jgi:hypothetical protein
MERIPRWATGDSRERDVEEYLSKRMKAIGGKTYKWKSPSMRSVPDRLVMHPQFHGRTLFVELKAPGKPATEAQNKKLDELVELGHAVFVLDSKAKVDEFIEDMCQLYGIEGK